MATPSTRNRGESGQSLLESQRLGAASWAFTTRRVPRDLPYRISRGTRPPVAGDLVLARVDLLGHHRGLQLSSGRRRSLFPGDEIVVVYGNRYASNQFEAVVPRTLGPCHLVAGGGVAAKALSWHNRISRGPTLITPVGFLSRADGKIANLRQHSLAPVEQINSPIPSIVAVFGTGMDAGKTTSAAFFVRGLRRAGKRIGFAKITGTGAGGDTWLLKDAGADPVLDFIDAGLVSTYLSSVEEIESVLVTLIAHLAKADVDAIVLEVADGVLQRETAALLESETFKATSPGILFTSGDALGAVSGTRYLAEHGHSIAGLAGVLTASPLQRKEAAAATGLPTFTREELAEPSKARQILDWIEQRRNCPVAGARTRLGTNKELAEHVPDDACAAPGITDGSGSGLSDLRPEFPRP